MDPFGSAANELQAFAGERGVRVMPISGTRYRPTTPNAERSTPNVSMEAVRLKCWALGVEREPGRFLTPQYKFIDRPDEAPASLESQGRLFYLLPLRRGGEDE